MANPVGMYFVSFATVYWVDIFVREEYMTIVADILNYCSKAKDWKYSSAGDYACIKGQVELCLL